LQVLFEYGSELSSRLEQVWNHDLAVDLKIAAGLSDLQMDEVRAAFSLQMHTGMRRSVPRIWVEYPKIGKVLPFPSPLTPRSAWKPTFDSLCVQHKIEQFEGGKVSEVSTPATTHAHASYICTCTCI